MTVVRGGRSLARGELLGRGNDVPLDGAWSLLPRPPTFSVAA